MNLKKSIFGFGAAAVLSLSMVTGVMAASSDSVEGSVELAKGSCSVTIDQGSANFGVWTYNGDEYVRTAGNNVSQLSGELKAGRPDGTCNITVQFTGLSGDSGTIDASHFGVGSNGVDFMDLNNTIASYLTAGVTGDVPALGPGGGFVQLNDVPNNYQPDTYTGTLDVTINATN